jgi:hypothetical protein
MKHLKLLLVTLLLCSLSIKAQIFGSLEPNESVSFIITQDVKLAFLEDDHGNKPFTSDFRITMLWKGLQTDYGNLEVRTGFEYADLAPVKYTRYSAGIGYSFNWMSLPLTDYKYAMAPFINYGVIVRKDNSAAPASFEFGFDLKFPVNDWLKIVCTQQWTDRNEIGKRLNSFKSLKDNFNWGMGAEIIVL